MGYICKSTFRIIMLLPFLISSLLPLQASKNEATTIIVFASTVREARQGEKVAIFTVNQLKKKGYNAILIDPKEYDLPLLDKRAIDYSDSNRPEILKKLSEQLMKADGYVVVSAIYNGSVPAALKNLIDHFGRNEFKDKPVSIITYSAGNYGGVQVISEWRTIFAVVGSITLPSTLSIPKVAKAFKKDGSLENTSLEERFNGLVEQLGWYISAIKNQKRADIK